MTDIDAPRSWWLDEQSRQDFMDAAKREQDRMKKSPVNRAIAGVVVGNGPAVTGSLRKA